MIKDEKKSTYKEAKGGTNASDDDLSLVTGGTGDVGLKIDHQIGINPGTSKDLMDPFGVDFNAGSGLA